jgi:hypothetical protein
MGFIPRSHQLRLAATSCEVDTKVDTMHPTFDRLYPVFNQVCTSKFMVSSMFKQVFCSIARFLIQYILRDLYVVLWNLHSVNPLSPSIL